MGIKIDFAALAQDGTSVTLISPQMLYDQPFHWLAVPHNLHETLGKLMELAFEDWPAKLRNIHCFACHNESNIGNIPGYILIKGLLVYWVPDETPQGSEGIKGSTIPS